MKQSILLTLALPLALSNNVQAKDAVTKSEKPNIIFIFADDLSINGLGSTSNGEVITPNLDKLRNRGTFFNQTFNQGGYNGAVSVASRAMIDRKSVV